MSKRFGRGTIAFCAVALACLAASTDAVGSLALEFFYHLWRKSNAASLIGNENAQAWLHIAQKSTHVALFGCLGAFAVRWSRRKLIPLAAGVALCVLAELSQFATATRQPNLEDGFLNLVAFCAGAVLGSQTTSRNIA